jgi:hypothetical protein
MFSPFAISIQVDPSVLRSSEYASKVVGPVDGRSSVTVKIVAPPAVTEPSAGADGSVIGSF